MSVECEKVTVDDAIIDTAKDDSVETPEKDDMVIAESTAAAADCSSSGGKDGSDHEEEGYQKPITTQTPSTPDTHSTGSCSSKEDVARIEHEHDVEEETKDHLEKSKSSDSLSSMNSSRSDPTSEASDPTSEASDRTSNILERAHERVLMQDLQDEVTNLKEIIEKQASELGAMSIKLREAVAAKSAIAKAHAELERHLAFNMNMKDDDVKKLRKSNLSLQEEHAKIERDIMDELIKLTNELNAVKETHRREREDWECKHRNEILEKDFQIASLSEELRKYKGGFGADDREAIWSTTAEEHIDHRWVSNTNSPPPK